MWVSGRLVDGPQNACREGTGTTTCTLKATHVLHVAMLSIQHLWLTLVVETKALSDTHLCKTLWGPLCGSASLHFASTGNQTTEWHSFLQNYVRSIGRRPPHKLAPYNTAAPPPFLPFLEKVFAWCSGCQTHLEESPTNSLLTPHGIHVG